MPGHRAVNVWPVSVVAREGRCNWTVGSQGQWPQDGAVRSWHWVWKDCLHKMLRVWFCLPHDTYVHRQEKTSMGTPGF